jgi:hypothetical protein
MFKVEVTTRIRALRPRGRALRPKGRALRPRKDNVRDKRKSRTRFLVWWSGKLVLLFTLPTKVPTVAAIDALYLERYSPSTYSYGHYAPAPRNVN